MRLVMALSLGVLSLSCAMGPTVKLADGSVMTLGGSLMTEASADARSLVAPTGLALNWVRGNVNETAVAKTAIMGATAVGVAAETTKTIVSNNGVKNVAAGEATKQAKIAAEAKTAEELIKGAGGAEGLPVAGTGAGVTVAPAP